MNENHASITDKLLSVSSFFVFQMIVCYPLMIFANKVLFWMHSPLLDYWTALSIWLLWIFCVIIPAIGTVMIFAQELAALLQQSFKKIFKEDANISITLKMPEPKE